MKKFILLTGIIITTLVSCSTDDTQLDPYNQNSSKTNFTTGTNSDFCITCRDSLNLKTTTAPNQNQSNQEEINLQNIIN